MTGAEPDYWAFLVERMDNPVIFVIVVAVGLWLFLSKRLAELQGSFAWVGTLARWWTARQRRHIEVDLETWRATHKADREREAAELEDLRLDVAYLRRELNDMRRREVQRDRQARAHTAWDNEWVPRAQAAGLDIPEPPPLYLDLAPLYVPEEEGT